MKLSQLKGESVVTLTEAQKVGVVEDVLTDSGFREIKALRIKSAGRGPDYLVPVQGVRAIGRDAVTIEETAVLQPERPGGMSSSDLLLSLNSILGCRVLTEDGEVVGSISDIHLDPPSLRIVSIEYGANRLEEMIGRVHTVSTADVVGVGQRVVTIRRSSHPSQAA